MFVAFTLSMPNRGSWNGRWSGEEKEYIRVRNFNVEEAKRITSTPNYFYNFGDGWSAQINTRIVNASQKNKLIKNSAGFCGYDWMIDSIIRNGEIINEKTKMDN